MRLKRKFFSQPTQTVAQKLLGKVLVRSYQGNRLAGLITETESYMGKEDKAAHVYGGKKTPRNKVVYKKAGLVYIYLCYGIYWQLNITTAEKKTPECVLIRALEPKEGLKTMRQNRKEHSSAEIKKDNLTDGPGKLCQALNLADNFYGEDLTSSKRLWLEKGEKISKDKIKKSPRIGIDYAQEYAEKPWRYYIGGNNYVSG